MLGPPLLSSICGLLFSSLIQCPLLVLGDTQPVMRMDKEAPRAKYNYDAAYDGELKTKF